MKRTALATAVIIAATVAAPAAANDSGYQTAQASMLTRSWPAWRSTRS